MLKYVLGSFMSPVLEFLLTTPGVNQTDFVFVLRI